MDYASERKSRSKIFYRAIVFVSIVVFLFLIYQLRTMIVPSIVGGLLAYACLPILRKLKQKGIPDSLALVFLLCAFVGGITLLTERIRDVIPDEDGKIILRIRIQYKLNEKYDEFIGKQSNFIIDTVREEIDPLYHEFVKLLQLTPTEQQRFQRYYQSFYAESLILERYQKYNLANVVTQEKQKEEEVIKQLDKKQDKVESDQQAGSSSSGFISKISDVVSTWLVAPFVFLFLLVDNGNIKKSLVMLVPNRYFEMVLAIINNVDDAIGKYLRGTMIECSLVGSSFFVCLFLIGIDLQWALIIGVIAGAANAIPFLGPAIGLVVGMFYALIAEDMVPLLPFIDPNNIIIWVLITVGIVQVLDNVVFQPIVLGSAVSLHPLVVIFGVMGGSVMFGFAGMLFAIPTIVIVKVVLSTLLEEMKAYHLIE